MIVNIRDIYMVTKRYEKCTSYLIFTTILAIVSLERRCSYIVARV